MLSAIIILTILGLICGLLLGLVAKKFAVEADPRIEQISEVLPGANCGGCGFGGCAAYAKAIVTSDTPINRCSPGGQKAVDEIARIMGTQATAQDVKFAVVHCAGDDNLCQQRAQIRSTHSCTAVNAIAGGPKACTYGCLGCGDCATVCPTGAIILTPGNLAVVRREKCIACGKCIAACPRHIITLESEKSPYQVLCSSQDTPKQRHGYCQASCLGCKMCTKKAPDIFEMKGLVANARPLQEKMEQAEEARVYCATNAIVNLAEISAEEWVTNPAKRAEFKEKATKIKAEAKAAKQAALAAQQEKAKAAANEAEK